MTLPRSIRLIAFLLLVLVVFQTAKAQEALQSGFDDYVKHREKTTTAHGAYYQSIGTQPDAPMQVVGSNLIELKRRDYAH